MGLEFVMQQAVERTREPYLAFASKQPHRTQWLAIAYDDRNVPKELFSDLKKAGWRQNPAMGVSPLKHVVKIDMIKDGTDLGLEWTPKEKAEFVHEVIAVLQKHGHFGIPSFKLTLADLL